MKDHKLIFFLLLSFFSFGQEREEALIVQNNIFTVSYNEVYEQPNWVEYKVRKITKKADRKGLNFYTVDSVWTSNNADYKNNIWDKGHLAPAAAFTDSKTNLKTTFSYLNFALQHNTFNRNDWTELEEQVRAWAKDYGDLGVRVKLHFEKNHLILPTGAHVPSAFTKTITFPNGATRCYYFLNQDTYNQDWKEFEVQCS